MPTPNFGVVATAYDISIRKSDGGYESASNCNGGDPSVISSRTCDIPVSVLLASPYSMTDGT